MIDYDREAASYDDTRGGPERAAAVAAAVSSLLPAGRPGAALADAGAGLARADAGPALGGTLLDVACGTGIVTALLSGGRSVLGVDRSAGMLSVAAGRLPGRVMLGDATRLPLGSGTVGTVLMVWLLHLLPAAEPVLDEAVRVLRPGGRLITTVDKSAAYFAAPSDVAEVTAPWRTGLDPADGFDRVAGFLSERGLRSAGESTFPGLGQGRSPSYWRQALRAGQVPWGRHDPGGVDRALAGLPDQERARPEPIYRLVAFS